MATDTQLEAQRLVSISLTKMAQSRTQRTGVSLHKSLLVATVLQKARFLCMEEVFRMVHNQNTQQQNQFPHYFPYEDDEEDEDDDDEEDDALIGLTPEEAGLSTNSSNNFNMATSSVATNAYTDQNYVNYDSSSQENHYVCSSDCDKENLAPSPVLENPTYFDLDKTTKDQCYRDRCSSDRYSYKNLKRRRAIYDTEIEDAVQSILPKKTKTVNYDSDLEDSVFLEDEYYSRHDECAEENSENKCMDIDRITSLVSIFSFGAINSTSSSTGDLSVSASSNCTTCSFGSLSRSSSTPDLCSAQAKENDTLPQRPFLAMTV